MCFEEDLNLLGRIAQRIEIDMLRGISAQSVHKSGAYNSSVADRYDGTWEVWGYNVIMDAVFNEQVFTMMRLWDDRDDVLSIPRASKILADTNFMEWFIQREPDNQGTFTADQREGFIRLYRKKFDRAYKDIKGNHVLERLRELRNKMLAHNAQDIGRPKILYGYADDLLEKTIPIAEAVNIIARSQDIGWNDEIELWEGYANTFWATAIEGIPEQKSG